MGRTVIMQQSWATSEQRDEVSVARSVDVQVSIKPSHQVWSGCRQHRNEEAMAAPPWLCTGTSGGPEGFIQGRSGKVMRPIDAVTTNLGGNLNPC